MLILHNDSSVIGKKIFVYNADPIFVCKTREENSKVKHYPGHHNLLHL
jgi:hypothetical protein